MVYRMIVDIATIRTPFGNANRAATKQYYDTQTFPDISVHKHNFEIMHNCNVTVKNSRWTSLDFPSELAYTIFLLRWA
jgi:hypothetical protein